LRGARHIAVLGLIALVACGERTSKETYFAPIYLERRCGLHHLGGSTTGRADNWCWSDRAGMPGTGHTDRM